MGMPGQPGFDGNAAFKAEREILGIVNHEWLAEKAERELLGDRYPESNDGSDRVDFARYDSVTVTYRLLVIINVLFCCHFYFCCSLKLGAEDN